MTYPSPAFHTTVFAQSGAASRRLRVNISRRVYVNTLTTRLCVTPSTQPRGQAAPHDCQQKSDRPSTTKSAYERHLDEMPSPERGSKSARVEENNEEEERFFYAIKAHDEAA